MTIYITGDIHASYDIEKLSSSHFDATGLTKDDYVIICGDFGLVWNNSTSEQYWLRWLDAKPFITLFVDGNHEGFHVLNNLPTCTWHGGIAHKVNDSVYHLMRDELYDLDGITLFAMGGAASSAYDKETRTKGIGWFPEEIPTQAEREHAIETLENANWNVDIVITHCAPTSCEESIAAVTNRLELHPMDEYTNWLETIRQKATYSQWFCGHYHIDAQLTNNITALYNKIAKLEIPAEIDQTQESAQDALNNASITYKIIEKKQVAIEPNDPFEDLEEDPE